MNPNLGRMRDRFINKLVGIDVRGTTDAFNEFLHAEKAWQARITSWQQESTRDMAIVHRRLVAELQALKEARDDISGLVKKLKIVRESDDYKRVHEEPEPLVSVRIASYNKTEELIEVAIASVLRQSYQRFEVVVVNDGPNGETRRAIHGLNDSRISFSELPQRSTYPADPHSRWMVAGSPAMNRAVELSRGTWIAPLDDDDEFSDDHIEKLVGIGNEKRSELAYGALVQKHLVHGTEQRIWSSPPAISQFSFQGSIYLRLLDFFRYDESSWVVDEPGDWNLIRRMSAAGVTMACIEDVVATMHMVPYTWKAAD